MMGIGTTMMAAVGSAKMSVGNCRFLALVIAVEIHREMEVRHVMIQTKLVEMAVAVFVLLKLDIFAREVHLRLQIPVLEGVILILNQQLNATTQML